MEFRLTYEGLLLGASRNNTRAEHKHEIRKVFGPQLRRVWEQTAERTAAHSGRGFVIHNARPLDSDALAKRFSRFGYQFVPLVTDDLHLNCAIEVLLLRPNPPGSVLQSGDLDNRLKTIFDALRLPNDGAEVGRYTAPGLDETPFFCLLQDDSMISKATVETDVLLQPVSSPENVNDARVIVQVKLKPAILTADNMVFA